MNKFAIGLVMLLLAGCSGITTKASAGFCMRLRCDSRIHIKDVFCGGCGNCVKHCISNFFQGPNK